MNIFGPQCKTDVRKFHLEIYSKIDLESDKTEIGKSANFHSDLACDPHGHTHAEHMYGHT